MPETIMSARTKKAIIDFQRDELTEYLLYSRLADKQDDEQNRSVLKRIAQDELRHAEILGKYSGEQPRPYYWKISLFILISRIFGLTFGVKLMELGETSAEARYKEIADDVPEVSEIIKEEDEHENELLNMLKEERLDYMGSIVLGLNDALVELTGTLAGLTFALQNTHLTAAAGLITGIAASMSMAASEYLSNTAEQQSRSKALKSALYTGVAYIFTVAVLILPYLLLSNGLAALGATLCVAVLIIFLFNFYLSVAKDLNFRRRFWEMAILSLSVAGISFGVGVLVRAVFGIDV